MKKTLALVLALAMVFSTITVAFAEDALGEDAQICEDLGMLKGETGTVDAAYVATAPTRLQAAVMFLRLKGLEAEALAFTGEENFADGDIAWAEGANLIAYLKANPQLGWIGDGVSFNPTGVMTAQAYYKVLLEALGYKQTTAEVAGDFTWEEVLTFAESVGLSKVAAVESFTVNDLAVATVEALKVNVKGTETTLAGSLVAAGVVDEAKAVAAGLVEAAPAAVAVELKEAKATGNAVVEVTFKAAVDEAAENVANYAIEGLEVNSAAISGTKTVILGTAAMTSGKVYKLTVGEKTVQFTGVAKVSGGPAIEDVVSEDVEEVVITFDKNIDLATGTDVANYSIAGVEIVSAEVDEDEVTLTTEGLKNKTKYTVKVTNIKSVDGAVKKSASESFTTKVDLIAPKIDGEISVRTNERIVLTFSEPVTQETAEDIENYSIKMDVKDGEEIEVISVTWDDDDEDNVEIVTEPMEKNKSYKLSVNGIADQRKVANVMTRTATKVYKAKAVDETAPVWTAIEPLSPTTILLTFTDSSNIDEESVLDLANYELEDLEIEDISAVSKNKYDSVTDKVTFKVLLTVEEMETTKKYKLTIGDVLDEFGNAMKESWKNANADLASFASAKLSSAVSTGEKKILLTFTKEVDEDTAEDIANYSIDEGIGAPTKATKKTATTVELEVNKLVEGYGEYDIIVDGVEDLSGNELYYKIKVTYAAFADRWDKTAPKLENYDAANKYVVALTFDEKVKFENGTELWLTGTGYPDTNPLKLYAKEYDDGDEVVEFSDAPNVLPDVTFTVYNVVYAGGGSGITDLIGNPFVFEFDAENTFVSSDADYDNVELDTYEQVNGRTFEVTMTGNVVLAGGNTVTTNGLTFTITTDDDEVTFVADGDIEEDEVYTFDFATLLEDKHGMPVDNFDTDTTTELSGEYTDEDGPEVEAVVAKNRKVIKITFNEDVKNVVTGDFELRNYDTDKAITGFSVTKVDDNIVEITVTKALEARYEYELKVKDASIQDISGNDNADEEVWYFNGTNLAE